MRRGWRAGTAGPLVAGWVIAGLVISVAPVTHSEESPSLSLPELLAEARTRNPELQAARQRVQALRAMPAQAKAWDDPTLSWEAWNAPDSFRLDHADNNIFRLSQKIPFPGKRRLAGDVASYDAERAAHDVGSVELMVVAGVKAAYYALWEAHARLEIFERDRALVARLTHVVEGKYGAGDASQSDVLRLQVDLTHIANEVQTQALAIQKARADLAALLSRPSSELVGVPTPPAGPRLSSSVDELVALALEHRPELLAEELAIARDTSAVDLANRGRLPDFEVSLGRFVNDGGRDGVGALASVTLPIFNRAKYDAAVTEATARLSATRSEKRRLEDRIRLEVEQAYLAARTNLLQYELFAGTHIPQAEQALRVTEGAYETGAAQFTELIDTLRRVQSVHLEHIAAQGGFATASAALEQAVGMELPIEASTPPNARHESPHG